MAQRDTVKSGLRAVLEGELEQIDEQSEVGHLRIIVGRGLDAQTGPRYGASEARDCGVARDMEAGPCRRT